MSDSRTSSDATYDSHDAQHKGPASQNSEASQEAEKHLAADEGQLGEEDARSEASSAEGEPRPDGEVAASEASSTGEGLAEGEASVDSEAEVEPDDATELADDVDGAVDAAEFADGADDAVEPAEHDVETEWGAAVEPDEEPDREPASDNPYDAYAALDPYADDDDADDDDDSDVTDYEAQSYRRASQYSRVNAARHYSNERKNVMVPVTVALVAGVVVLAGVLAFLFGSRPATLAMLESLGFKLPEASQPADASDDADSGDGEAAPAAEPVDINLTMVGDTLIQPSVLSASQTSTGEYDFSKLFSSVGSDISDADIALVDQESSMAGQAYGYASNVPYNAPDSLGTAEEQAGLDVVLKANNYALDLGYNGLHAELQTWSEDDSSMQVLGVADPNGTVGTDRVNNVYIYEKDGFKVAILNYTYGTDTTVSSSTDSSYVATLSEDKVKADVAAARDAGADMIVACPHWGVEYSTNLSNEETTYAQLFANEGVDVVLGDHPHVVQPVKVITNSDGHACVCFYSVGNFVSGTRNTNALVGSLAKVTLHKDADGTCSVTAASLVPVVTHRANGTAFGVYRLSDYTDDLARQGWDASLTPDYVRSLLDQVLGLSYDDESGAYQVDLSDTMSVDDVASSAQQSNANASVSSGGARGSGSGLATPSTSGRASTGRSATGSAGTGTAASSASRGSTGSATSGSAGTAATGSAAGTVRTR